MAIYFGDYEVKQVFIGDNEVTEAYFGNYKISSGGGSNIPTEPGIYDASGNSLVDLQLLSDNAFTGETPLCIMLENQFEINPEDIVTIVVPSATPGGETILSLGESNLANLRNLKTVICDNRVESLPNGLFYGDENLTKVVLNKDHIYSIGDACFRGCSSLKEVNLTEQIHTIGAYCFEDCTSLIRVSGVTDGAGDVTYIPSDAFSGCTSLSEFNFSNITSIAARAFSYTGLTAFNGASVIDIGYRAFYGCASLTAVFVDCQTIASGTFESCTGLHTVSIGTSVQTVAPQAFYLSSIKAINCASSEFYVSNGMLITNDTNKKVVLCRTDISNVTVPSGVKAIGSYVFSYFKTMTSISLPSTLTSIAEYAFYWCSSLKSITVPDSVTSIGTYAFYRCSGITTATLGVGITTLNSNVFGYCSKLSSLTLPAKLTSIGASALTACTSLTSITIPSTVTSIGTAAFSGCVFKSIALPSSISTLSAQLFYNCTSLTSVSGIDNITSIGTKAFYGCTALASFSIPSKVTALGTYAFYNCTALKEMTIPANTVKIGNYAFNKCTNLASVTFANTSNWYRTSSSAYSGGSVVDVTNAATNATRLKSTSGYYNYYWYRKTA